MSDDEGYAEVDDDDYENVEYDEEYGSDIGGIDSEEETEEAASVSDEEEERGAVTEDALKIAEPVEDIPAVLDEVAPDDDFEEKFDSGETTAAAVVGIKKRSKRDALPLDGFAADQNEMNIARIIYGDNRVTSNHMQMFEVAEILAIRSRQLEKNPTIFTNVHGETSVMKMALQELKDGRCPLKLRRKIGEKKKPTGEKITYYEEWSARELTLPDIELPHDFM